MTETALGNTDSNVLAQSLRLSYRPLRVGFCVRDGNFDDLRQALLLTHTLCGGRYNPLIPVQRESLSSNLVRAFRVDVLFPVADDNRLRDFITKFPHLRWPDFEPYLFYPEDGRGCALLDVSHQVALVFEDHIKGQEKSKFAAKLFSWATNDPLGDALLAYFGSYADKSVVGHDYRALVAQNLRGELLPIGPEESIPSDCFKAITPSVITRYAMEWDRPPLTDPPHGIYVGSASDYDDLLTFWNLRAANIELVFYDPSHGTRLDALKSAVINEFEKLPADPHGFASCMGVWTKSPDYSPEGQNWGTRPLFCSAGEALWSRPRFRAPMMQFERQWAFVSLSTDADRPSIAFQLPKKPFQEHPRLHRQKFIVSLNLRFYIESDPKWTFRTPFLPVLNDFWGREALFKAPEARIEPEGLGVIADLGTQHLTVRAVEKRALVDRLFQIFGMRAKPSAAGRIAERLLQQMGGPQGCRVFKITGVRKLIGAYGPLKSFKRSAALQIIGEIDPVTRRPNLDRFNQVFIEGRRVTPDSAFSVLLKKGVFRVGMDLRCPNCELDFWVHLDDIASEVVCELCSARFNITTQLRDRDWAYRRSGIFGNDDHQQGAIPVALTLQQIDTIIHSEPIVSLTSMEIEAVSAKIKRCESDLIVLTNSYDDRVQLLIGECKAGGPKNIITEDDVAKLTAVADAFPSDQFRTFVLFSKTAPFSPEEIAQCRKAQPDGRYRVILLTDRELEPYFVYQQTAQEFQMRHATAVSLEDLAAATHEAFFDPKPKKPTSA